MEREELATCGYLNSKDITVSMHFRKQHPLAGNPSAKGPVDGVVVQRMRLGQNPHEPPLMIANEGGELLDTNYFDSEMAQNGFLFLSWNASVARVLVPDAQRSVLPEMATGKECVITRGTFEGGDALEVMFDDHSDAPFAVYLSRAATDRWFESDGRPITVAVWTRDGKHGEWIGTYRTGTKLPCLRPSGR